MNIEEQGEKYRLSTADNMYIEKRGFIAGINSDYVEYDKIISLIEENESILKLLEMYGNDRTRLPVKERIKELKERLSDIKR
jgi:hypothetical protein